MERGNKRLIFTACEISTSISFEGTIYGEIWRIEIGIEQTKILKESLIYAYFIPCSLVVFLYIFNILILVALLYIALHWLQ